MIEKFKKLNIWVKDIVTWFIFWTAIVWPSIEKIFKKAFPAMVNNYFYIFSFLITGILTIPAVFSVHAYYFQKKEIRDIKNEIEFIKKQACFSFIDINTDLYTKTGDILNKMIYKAANIYHNFAFISSDDYDSLVYSRMALEQYIEVKDQKMIRQLLNEMISIIKEMKHGLLSSKDVSELNQVINKVNRKEFASEIQQINKLIGAIT